MMHYTSLHNEYFSDHSRGRNLDHKFEKDGETLDQNRPIVYFRIRALQTLDQNIPKDIDFRKRDIRIQNSLYIQNLIHSYNCKF